MQLFWQNAASTGERKIMTKISGILQQTSCVSSKLKGTNRNKKQLSLTKVPSDDFQNTTTNAFKKVAS